MIPDPKDDLPHLRLSDEHEDNKHRVEACAYTLIILTMIALMLAVAAWYT